MHFTKLDDSPMFRQQIQCLEESAETLREKSLRFYKGCRKYTDGLGEGHDRDVAFASALETFGGGHNDPTCVSFGGPDMTKFVTALREIATYKEVLRAKQEDSSCQAYVYLSIELLFLEFIVLAFFNCLSQVEHSLNDRLSQLANVDLQDVKEARKRFDKANVIYDQVREKFLSLRKSSRMDITAAIEERDVPRTSQCKIGI